VIIAKAKAVAAGIIKFKNHKTLSVTVVFVCSFMLAFIAERALMYGLRTIIRTFISILGEHGLSGIFAGFSMMSVYRMILLFCIFFFFLIHFIIKIPVFYDLIFRYRYVLAVMVLLLLVSNKIHLSSVGMYDEYIQPGYSTEFTKPVFGWLQPVRSDEWMITTPIQLAAQFDPEPFGRFNYIARGTATENMPNGVAVNFATLAFPMSIFYIFGAEYGVSARWVGTLILTFMVTFEFALIISGRNRLLALAGACLITFSPFFQWWSYVYFITSGLGALVCLYHFLINDNKVKRLFLSLGLAIFLSQFIVTIYPAWQVPAGILYFSLAIWILMQNWDKVRLFDKIDYGCIGLSVILIAGIVAAYLYNSREYLEILSNTVYPGLRLDPGGNTHVVTFTARTVLGGIYGPLPSARALYDSNICEFGGFYTLFPVPVLFASFIMIRKKIVDSFSIILIAFSVILFTYIFIGWPLWLARITFMSYSQSMRTLDIFAFAQVLLLIRVLSIFSGTSEESKKLIKPGILAASTVVSLCLTISIYFLGRVTFFYDTPPVYTIISFFGIIVITYSMFDLQRNKKVFQCACLYMIILSCLTVATIHPVSRGLDAIYEKPLAKKIAELAVDNEQKWVSLHSIVGSSYLIANGASTISSTNFYPNLDLWYKLDPERKFEYVYNRYANIVVSLTTEETSFELLYADTLSLILSIYDLEKINVKYIHSFEPIEISCDVPFDLLYNEDSSFIYSVVYN